MNSACTNFNQWPPPTTGHVLHLPIMGSVLQIRLPSKFEKTERRQSSKSPEPVPLPAYPQPIILSSVHELPIFEYIDHKNSMFFWLLLIFRFRSLQPLFSHLHVLWEIILIGEPLVIMGPSPSVVANVVESLIRLSIKINFLNVF